MYTYLNVFVHVFIQVSDHVFIEVSVDVFIQVSVHVSVHAFENIPPENSGQIPSHINTLLIKRDYFIRISPNYPESAPYSLERCPEGFIALDPEYTRSLVLAHGNGGSELNRQKQTNEVILKIVQIRSSMYTGRDTEIAGSCMASMQCRLKEHCKQTEKEKSGYFYPRIDLGLIPTGTCLPFH